MAFLFFSLFSGYRVRLKSRPALLLSFQEKVSLVLSLCVLNNNTIYFTKKKSRYPIFGYRDLSRLLLWIKDHMGTISLLLSSFHLAITYHRAIIKQINNRDGP